MTTVENIYKNNKDGCYSIKIGYMFIIDKARNLIKFRIDTDFRSPCGTLIAIDIVDEKVITALKRDKKKNIDINLTKEEIDKYLNYFLEIYDPRNVTNITDYIMKQGES